MDVGSLPDRLLWLRQCCPGEVSANHWEVRMLGVRLFLRLECSAELSGLDWEAAGVELS